MIERRFQQAAKAPPPMCNTIWPGFLFRRRKLHLIRLGNDGDMAGLAVQQRKRVAKQTGELLNLVPFFFFFLFLATNAKAKEMTRRDRADRGQGQVGRTGSLRDCGRRRRAFSLVTIATFEEKKNSLSTEFSNGWTELNERTGRGVGRVDVPSSYSGS